MRYWRKLVITVVAIAIIAPWRVGVCLADGCSSATMRVIDGDACHHGRGRHCHQSQGAAATYQCNCHALALCAPAPGIRAASAFVNDSGAGLRSKVTLPSIIGDRIVNLSWPAGVEGRLQLDLPLFLLHKSLVI